MQQVITKSYEVRRSVIHGSGVFALRSITKGERVMQYFGEKVSAAEGDRRLDRQIELHEQDPTRGATYIFSLDDEWDLDGDVPENDAKYVNHSCDPNLDVVIEDGKIYYDALRLIGPGDELSVDYGFDFDEGDVEDNPCRCGSPSCCGYMVRSDERDKLAAYLARKAERKD